MALALGDGFSLLVALAKAHRDRTTGVVEVAGEGAVSLLYVQDGVIVFADEGTLGDTLGQILLREGKLSQAQYARIIDRMTEALVDNEQMRFGEVAIELGCLSPSEVHDALHGQMRRKALRCLQWADPQVRVMEDAEALEGVARFPVDPLSIMTAAIREYGEPRCDAGLAPTLSSAFVLHESPRHIAEALHLVAAEVRLLKDLAPGEVVRDLLTAVQRDRGQRLSTKRLLLTLLLTGHASLHDPATKQRHSLTPAPMEAMRSSDADAAKRHREAVARRRAAELALRLQRARRGGGSADDLKSAERAQKLRLKAEQLKVRGMQAMSAGNLAGALSLFAQAREAHDTPTYRLAEAWVKMRTTQDERDAAESQEAAIVLARSAVKDNREDAFAWRVIGEVALARQDLAQAEKAFKMAVRADERDTDAVRYLRLVQMRRGSGR